MTNPPPSKAVWMPIETAPKDGSMILGWYKGWHKPLVIWWYTGSRRWNTAMEPTHWTPIPDPPTKQDASEQKGAIK